MAAHAQKISAGKIDAPTPAAKTERTSGNTSANLPNYLNSSELTPLTEGVPGVGESQNSLKRQIDNNLTQDGELNTAPTKPTSAEQKPSKDQQGGSKTSSTATRQQQAGNGQAQGDSKSQSKSTGAQNAEQSNQPAANNLQQLDQIDGEQVDSDEGVIGPTRMMPGQGEEGENERKLAHDLVAILPKLSPIATPDVPSPPKPAMERREEVIKRTGSPPELHHAQVRNAVERVSQAARDARRQMLWQVSNTARETRLSIEDKALAIKRATSAAVGAINAAIGVAVENIDAAGKKEAEFIKAKKAAIKEEVLKNKDANTLTIANKLREGANAIKKLDEKAKKQFEPKMKIAQAKIKTVPAAGSVAPIADPGASKKDTANKNDNKNDKKDEGDELKNSPYKVIGDAREALDKYVDTMSATESHGKNHTNYRLEKGKPVVKGVCNSQQKNLVKVADGQANNIASDATMARFMNMVLGLTSPVAESVSKDKAKLKQRQEFKMDEGISAQENQTNLAVRNLGFKVDDAKKYCQEDLRKNLTDNILKSGNKAYTAITDQARGAEVTLNNSAVGMVQAYYDLVTRMRSLLPPGRFLDARQLLPKLHEAKDSAQKLLQQHTAVTKTQAAAIEKQLGKVIAEQVKSILESGQKSAASVNDVVVRCRFDFLNYATDITGVLRKDIDATIAEASKFAEKTAESLLNTKEQVEGEGIPQINSYAISFLNGAISGAMSTQYNILKGFVEELSKGEYGKSPLTEPMKRADSDLGTRSKNIDAAIRPKVKESTGSKVLKGAIAVASPGAAVGGAIADKYKSHKAKSSVIGEIGALSFTGVSALKEYFTAITSGGDLIQRITEGLEDPEKQQALDLFNADKRPAAQKSILEDSTGTFSGVNRHAREQVARGLGRDIAAAGNDYQGLSSEQLQNLRNHLVNDLDEHQGTIAVAFIDNKVEKAVAAQTREKLENAESEGRWGFILSGEEAQKRSDKARVDVMRKLQSGLEQELKDRDGFVDPEQLDRSTLQVFKEFAVLDSPLIFSPDMVTDDMARNAMIHAATRGHGSMILGFGTARFEAIQMSEKAAQHITDIVKEEKGVNSTKARASYTDFVTSRAEDDSILGIDALKTLSKNSQTDLTDAFENTKLAGHKRDMEDPTKTPLERSKAKQAFEEERAKHREFLQAAAKKMGAPDDIVKDPERAENWMSLKVGGIFARADNPFTTQKGTTHATYGQELITQGRASLAASVALATDGPGTHDSLLLRAYQDRSKHEVKEARATWKELYNEDLDEMLGVKKRKWDASDYAMMAASPFAWMALRGSETSGDLTMQLELLAEGNPETDADYSKLAAMRCNQERRGTGPIARRTMAGTWQQQHLDKSQAQLANYILDSAAKENPELAAKYRDNPGAIFAHDGTINADVYAAAFDDKNNLRHGDSMRLQYYGNEINFAADFYRAEIDRQEALMTSAITALALLVSVVLLVVPGVNLVAAGVITAILAGAATIAVKAGMRGERYGWEEMATDVAITAIEAATAGVGGAMGGGVKSAGKLARIGQAINQAAESVAGKTFGKALGAAAREGMVSAVSTGAQMSLQDGIWDDGIGAGLDKIAAGSLKAAAVAAVTAGVSESLSTKIGNKLAAPDINATNITGFQKLGQTLGPKGSAVFAEALSELVGTMAGEAVNISIDYANNKFTGKFGDAVMQIGEAGLRDMAVAALRTTVMNSNRSRYRDLLDAARKNPNLNDADLRVLRLAAISAGSMLYDDGLHRVRQEVDAGRNLLAQLPPHLRDKASSLDFNSLQQMVDVVRTGDWGELQSSAKFIHELSQSAPGIDGPGLMRDLENTIARNQRDQSSEQALDPGEQQRVKQSLTEGLDPRIKPVLDKNPVEGLQHLGAEDLRIAADMVSRGEFDSASADALLRAAKNKHPELNEFSFLQNLHQAVQTSRHAQDRQADIVAHQRYALMTSLPQDSHQVVGRLSDSDVERLHDIIQRPDATPQEIDQLFRAIKTEQPHLERDHFHQLVNTASQNHQAQVQAARESRRVQRQQHMSNIPPELRANLSALPDHALVELQLRQQQGSLSPAEKNRLLDMARAETPAVNIKQLSDSLDRAMQSPPPRISDKEETSLRRELQADLPPELRAEVAGVRLLVLSDQDFAGLTRSQKGQAVTLIMHGEAVVVMRQGADPSALREEGMHVLQAKDPRWRDHMRQLDESRLARWPELSIEEQLHLYGIKMALEIDAQQRIIDQLQQRIAADPNAKDIDSMRMRLDMAEATMKNLAHRQAEAGASDTLDIMNIKAGFSAKPQWLDQAPRLFNKLNQPRDGPEVVRSPEAVQESADKQKLIKKPSAESEAETKTTQKKAGQDTLEKVQARFLDGLQEGGTEARKIQNIIKDMDESLLRTIHTVAPDADTARRFLRKFSGSADDVTATLAALNRLPEAVRGPLASALANKRNTMSDFAEGMAAIHDLIKHSEPGQTLLHTLVTQHADDFATIKQLIANLKTIEANAGAEHIGKLLSVSSDVSIQRNLVGIAAASADPRVYVEAMVKIKAALGDADQTGIIKVLARNISGADDLATTIARLVNLKLDDSARLDIVNQVLDRVGVIDSPEYRKKFLTSVDTFNAIAARLGINAEHTAKSLKNLLILAKESKIRFEFMDTANGFLKTLADQHADPNAKKLLEHIKTILTSADAVPDALNKPFIDLIDDLKQVPGMYERTADKAGLLKTLAETAATKQNMLGGNPTELRIQVAESRWPDFAAKNPDFVKLLIAETPHLSPRQRALLADVQPWFDHIVGTDWFNNMYLAQAGGDKNAAKAALMRDLVNDAGLGNKTLSDRSADDFRRHLESAVRESAALTRTTEFVTTKSGQLHNQEMDFYSLIREQMRELGFSDKDITKRFDNLEKVWEQARKTGSVAPENHLYDLLMQQKQYEAMIEVAKHLVQKYANTLDPKLSDQQRQKALKDEFNRLTQGLKQKVTEVAGEIATTRHMMVDPTMQGFTLLRGFEAGTGFDQVWVKMGKKGELEFVIAEGKGPNAELGDPNKGKQMSPEWVAKTLQEMLSGSDQKTAIYLIESLIRSKNGQGPPVTIRGLVVKGDQNGGVGTTEVAPGTIDDKGTYRIAEILNFLIGEKGKYDISDIYKFLL